MKDKLYDVKCEGITLLVKVTYEEAIEFIADSKEEDNEHRAYYLVTSKEYKNEHV
jgi:hypothetical protein